MYQKMPLVQRLSVPEQSLSLPNGPAWVLTVEPFYAVPESTETNEDVFIKTSLNKGLRKVSTANASSSTGLLLCSGTDIFGRNAGFSCL